jgi:hypothetical protein
VPPLLGCAITPTIDAAKKKSINKRLTLYIFFIIKLILVNNFGYNFNNFYNFLLDNDTIYIACKNTFFLKKKKKGKKKVCGRRFAVS